MPGSLLDGSWSGASPPRVYSRRARERKEGIEKLKDERTDHHHLVQMLIDELATVSPWRARELGLIESRRKPESRSQSVGNDSSSPSS